MFPTVDNPLILIYQGVIPAMKNDTQVYLTESPAEKGGMVVAGVGRSKETNIWLTSGEQMAERQMKVQGFEKMTMPTRISCFCTIGMYKSPSNKDEHFVPRNDLDNAYTTIQETWKETIMDDDKQIIDYHVSTRIFTEKSTMYTTVFLWSTEPSNSPSDRQLTELVNIWKYSQSKPIWSLLKDKQNG